MCGVNYKNVPSNFVNCYISTDYRAYMIFDKTEDYDIVFHHYLQHLKDKNKNIIEYIDQEDEMIIVFTIPDKYLKNFDLFIRGKYSKFDEDYKQIVCNYFGKRSINDSHIVSEYNTLYPQEFKRKFIAKRIYEEKDMQKGLKILNEIYEVLDPPNLEKEMYKSIEQITEQEEKQI